MVAQRLLIPERSRKITGSFAFIEHRFFQHGFWSTLSHQELLLYLFLVIVGDRNGLSYYGYDKICSVLRLTLDEYIPARNALIDKDLLAFDGYLFQVLSLPEKPVIPSTPNLLKTDEQMEQHDPATIKQLITNSLWGDGNGK